jgi:hypothetical protein
VKNRDERARMLDPRAPAVQIAPAMLSLSETREKLDDLQRRLTTLRGHL